MNNVTLRIAKSLLAGLFVLLLGGGLEPALAHGDERTLQRSLVTVGAYRASIWTSPPILRTGEVHVETTLFDQTGKLAQTGLVHVTLIPLERQIPALSALATPVGAAKGIWAAAFDVSQPGRYRVEVAIIDNANGGTVDFELEIIRVAGLIRVLLTLQLLASGVAAIWLIHTGLTIWFGHVRQDAPMPLG